ncbi:embryonic stem cell-specific 5-hydroxymethylcytosine-binding protein-like [Plakobranchus ocellatus]|uniref:Abasic site processing protein HMCES n=1 Tax=Plakobranchus ocellatus TaxID=259542 RepID=A0AAV3YZM1_9GAST|nr:embryonic stem cell-specific 5-hydroxymethylcytosine-binding protein-like [Plakobranchus ocellatus]
MGSDDLVTLFNLESSPPLYSYSVITVSSSPDMSWCHHRMPAILSSEEEVQKWLDFSTVSLSEAVTLIKPKICLTHHAVSKQVNSSRYQALECIKPILNESKPSPECKLMQKWLQPGKKKLQETDARKYVAGGFGSTVACESALRSAGTLLLWVRAPLPAPWPDRGPENLRSPCCGLAIWQEFFKRC